MDFKLQELGENITTADVVNVLVKVGDSIQKEQPVFEMETEKATFEVPSTVAGTVKEIHVKVGDKVKVGQLLMTLEEGEGKKETGEEKKKPETGNRKTEEGRQETGEEKKPEAGSRKTEEGRQEPGEKKKRSEAGSQEEEKEKKEEVEEKEETGEKEGEKKETGGEKKPEAGGQRPEGLVQKPTIPASGFRPPASQDSDLPASPLVRRLSRELKVDLKEIAGTGSGGRILPEDVTGHHKNSQGAGSPPTLPDFAKWGSVERKPMSNIRRVTAEHVSRAWRAIPHVTQFDEADITELEGLRKRFAKRVEVAGGHLSLTAILLKVAASALKVFPQMNASVDLEHEEIVYKNYFHVGIAVATDRGLLVPVIRDVDQKNILDLSIELNQVTEKARTKKLTLDEMQGATFTVTNLGNIGGGHFTPIINWPEVAILGVGRAKVESVWVEEKFEPRMMLPLSLSYDHRLIDGADGAKFLRWLADAVTEPFLMDLEG